jgi:ankyrin repeat protein
MNRIDEELIEATRENNLPEVSRLFRAGADVNAKDRYGDTPLHFACSFGHVQVVIALLDRGADTEVKDRHGWTPLHWASLYNHLAVVKALLSGGANILAVNDYGRLPIHFAVSKGNSEVAKCLLQHIYATTRRLPLHELVEDLTRIGNSGIRAGGPPLHYALRHDVLGTDDVVEIIEYLVGRNPALVSSRDQDGSFPLHVACRRGASFAIVQSLVNLYEASVKSVTSEGDLPLFLACEMPETSLDTIFLLMKLYPDLVYR